MSEAAFENRPITAGDLKKAIKHLTYMRNRRVNLLEKYATDTPDHASVPFIEAARRALIVAIRILEDGRDEVFKAIAERLAASPSPITPPKEATCQ